MRIIYVSIFVLLVSACSGEQRNQKNTAAENINDQTADNQVVVSGTITGAEDAEITLMIGGVEVTQSASDPFTLELTLSTPFGIEATKLPVGKDCMADQAQYSATNGRVEFTMACHDSINIALYHDNHMSRFTKCIFNQVDGNTLTSNVKGIYCHQDKALQSTHDLRYFSGLKTLELTNTGLTAIDLSKNYQLKRLELQGNNLKSLDLSQNLQLEYLDLRNNDELAAIDLTRHAQLQYVDLPDHLQGSGDNIFRLRGKVSGIQATDDQVKVDFNGDIWSMENGAEFYVSLSTAALDKIRFIRQPAGQTCQFEKTLAGNAGDEVLNNIICSQ